MLPEIAQRTLESEARRAFASSLSSLPGAKSLLVDPLLYDAQLSLARPLELFSDTTFLREHGIRYVAPIESSPSVTMQKALAQPAIVAVIRAVNAAAARHMVQLILNVRQAAETAPTSSTSSNNSVETTAKQSASTKFLILTTPRRSKIVEKVFTRAALSDIPISVLPFGFFPFDGNLVTLDWPQAFRQIVLDGDNSAILATSAALSSMAKTLNLEFATIRSAGAAAAAVAEELLETHGQMYSVHHNSDSLPSSVQSSPAVSTRHLSASAFADHQKLALLDSKSASTSVLPSNPNDESQMPTLAEVVEKSSKLRAVNLVIVDRGCDLVSPLLTQGTYEGLLDEAIGLHNNIIDLPISSIVSEDAMELLRSKNNTPSTTVTARKRLRADIDPVFGQLRDLSFSAAFSQIGTVANSLQEFYDSRPNRDTFEMGKLQNWMQGLPGATSDHSLAAIHTALGYEVAARTFNSYEFRQRFEMEREMIEDGNTIPRCTYITDAIARGASLTHVLRLCCLWSATTSGIDSNDFDFVRKEILAIFGLGVMPLLANLERAGLLVRSLREPPRNNLGWIFPNFGGGHTERYIPSETGSTTGSVRSFSTSASDESKRSRSRSAEYSWQFARRALQLITELDQDRPAHPGTRAAVATAYSGYTPLSVRLVEAGLSEEGWGSLPHILSHMSLLPPGHTTLEHRREEIRRDEDGFDAVIVFVGGITRAEATAVRMASKASGMKALIATTAVLGPDEFMLSLDESLIA
eukprot:TRINITY_DN266_c0_g1_i3.p1 TRINITY_DN266_c0_g1~~TRINITY_DN266_c0_g1_i3.p1  ORF type:complete len:752 (-),score=93.75 TRINITY_DN266_c0_g1_i3:2811-5066(-)